jgi:hypothetical protein
MSSLLAGSLQKLADSGLKFPDMNLINVREILKEISNTGTDAVIQQEVDKLVGTPHLADALMKVIYIGLRDGGNPKANANLFKWHSALVDAVGSSAIVRCLTDKEYSTTLPTD